MDEYLDDTMFLLLDSGNEPLGRGRLEGFLHTQSIKMTVLDGNAEAVDGHEIIQIVGMGDKQQAIRCQLIKREGNLIHLNKIIWLSPDFRSNLRIPVKFDSFIYPISVSWKGRKSIVSMDLACGGIAFYSDSLLEDGERFEVVIPVTAEPVILKCKVLRRQQLNDGRYLYAVKFLDLCNDEERLVRAAVFRIQVENARHFRIMKNHSA